MQPGEAKVVQSIPKLAAIEPIIVSWLIPHQDGPDKEAKRGTWQR